MQRAAGEAPTKPGTRPGGAWRWIPAIALALSTLGLFATPIVWGGLAGVTAWIVLPTLNALLGVLVALAALGRLLWRREATARRGVSLGVGLLAAWPMLWLGQVATVPYPISFEGTEPKLEVRWPADREMLVFWGGDDVFHNYHAAAPDQRWAYDLVIEPVLAGSERLSDYGCYGVPIVAPIAGEIVMARDGEPDAVPGQLSGNVEAPLGNAVAIRTEHGTYLVLAHLAPGSVRVAVGDRVEEGQPIGACGNSGNTSEPHLHIHHQRQDPTRFPVGFAEGLPLSFRDVEGPSRPRGGVVVEAGRARPVGDRVRPR